MTGWRRLLRRIADALRSPVPICPEDEVLLESIEDLQERIAVLEVTNRRLAQKVRDHVPCQCCGWAQSRPPALDEEPPIVRGALNAQAQAESRLFRGVRR